MQNNGLQQHGRAARGRAEALDRARHGIERARRTEGIILAGVGALFVVFALGSFALAVGLALNGAPISAFAGAGGFGLFWVVMATLMLVLGLRRIRVAGRNERLMTSGVTTTATVMSFTEASYNVDRHNVFTLVLRVALPGRPPFDITRKGELVPLGTLIYTDLSIPVVVDPQSPGEMMIDWTRT